MCSTVFGASFGYVSNSNVPFIVSTTITGPAPGDLRPGVAGAVGAVPRPGCAGVAPRPDAPRGVWAAMSFPTTSSASTLPTTSFIVSSSRRVSARVHANSSTVVGDRAIPASRIDRPADVLTPCDQIQVDQRPPSTIGRLVEGLLRLLR